MVALSTVIIPNTTRTFDAALRQLGGDVEFAARLLGAGTLRRMVRIVAPMIRPALLSAWLFAFMHTAILVSVPIVLRAPGQEMLSLVVWSLITDTGDLGQGSAVALLQGLVAGSVVLLARRVARGQQQT
jgi:iron(III) transport system permease protein